MDDRKLDYLLKKSEIELHESAEIRNGFLAMQQAMKEFKKDLQNTPVCDDEFDNPYEDPQEEEQMQKRTDLVNIFYSGSLAERLAASIKNKHGDRPICSYTGTLADGMKYEVNVTFK